MPNKELLKSTEHRTWLPPEKSWSFYQEWNDAVFLHWEVSYDDLRALVPTDLTLDHFEGKYYVSIVAFKMEKIRPRHLPAVSFISNFHEINVRTYVTAQEKPGVYFINIEASSSLSAFICRKLSGLPYEKAAIIRTDNSYISHNSLKQFDLNIQFETLNDAYHKSELDFWITERYCLYITSKKKVFRFQTHHREWEIQKLKISNLEVKYHLGELNLEADNLDSSHYSKGVKVIAWNKELVHSSTYEKTL